MVFKLSHHHFLVLKLQCSHCTSHRNTVLFLSTHHCVRLALLPLQNAKESPCFQPTSFFPKSQEVFDYAWQGWCAARAQLWNITTFSVEKLSHGEMPQC